MSDTQQIDDGGPAFPAHDLSDGICNQSSHGMTLRDYFAGQALAGILGQKWAEGSTDGTVTKACYQLADHMITTRKIENL